jgi:dihydroxyacetone kinase-like predicted kinase
VGAAIEAGIAAGRPHRIVVTHFAEQIAAAKPKGRVVLTTAAGPGLADLFGQAGANVVPPSDGRRCSTADLLAALLASGAGEVVVLPNDRHVLDAAEAAARQARERGLRVAVIPTSTQVQGLAALAVHEPGRGFDDDVVHMTAAAGHTRHGAVTIATRRAMTSAGPCEPGDVLGVVDGDFQVVGSSVLETAERVLDRLLVSGGELVTVVTGRDAAADLAAQLEAHVVADRPELDVLVHDGGQEGYPLFLAVE